MTISVGSSVDRNGPRKKSLTAIVRSPEVVLATTDASSASITDPQSPAGSA